MFFGFLILWIIFNGKFNLEILLFGIVISAALEFFTLKIMGQTHKNEIKSALSVFRFIPYFIGLVVEIIRCNFKLIWLIMHPKEEIEPQLVYFHSKLKSENLRVLLANSITLTPGTITVGLLGERFHVHALDKSFAEGLENSEFEQQLLKMEDDNGAR